MQPQNNPVNLVGVGFGESKVYDLSAAEYTELRVLSEQGTYPTIDEIVAEYGKTYEPIRQYIGNIIDVAYVTLNGQNVVVFCDDEGLLNSGLCAGWNIISDNGSSVKLMGRLVFADAATDGEGETLSSPLSKTDIAGLIRSRRITPIIARLN